MDKNTFMSVRQFSESFPVFPQATIREMIFKSVERDTPNGCHPANGLLEAGAIVRVGRKILIHVPRFFDWVESQNAARVAGDVMPKTMTARELLEKTFPKKVKIERNGLLLAEFRDGHPSGWVFSYRIPWGRINSQLKLINWIRHLVDKPWVDKEIIEGIIDAADEKFQFGVHDCDA